MQAETDGCLEALHRLKSIDPPLYLTASPELSKTVLLASQYLFSSLNPFAPKSPFTHPLTQGFDAEQIWQQIDIQCQSLISSVCRQVRNFEKNPLEMEKQFNLDKRSEKQQDNVRKGTGNKAREDVESERQDFDADDDERTKMVMRMTNDNDHDDGDGDGDMENEEINNVNGVEDMFLKINELEEYLEEDEAREYGLKKEKKGNRRKRVELMEEDEDEEDEDEEDEEVDGGEDADGGDEEELELLELADDDDVDDENR